MLEVGCGTGQLTRALLERGLRVTALEPGDRLIRIAEEKLRGAGDADLVAARLEDARIAGAGFRAVFSASAIHWVDPDVGWRKIAGALAPGGTLALIQYFGLHEDRSADDQHELLAALRRHAPQVAARWPAYRDLDATLAGVHERRRNIAEAWSWLGSYDIGRGHAADLFDELQLAALPAVTENTAAELIDLLSTMSCWARFSAAQRDALANDYHALERRLGRPILASTVAILVTARRRAAASRSAQGRLIAKDAGALL